MRGEKEAFQTEKLPVLEMTSLGGPGTLQGSRGPWKRGGIRERDLD